jgi:hypothetical protein
MTENDQVLIKNTMTGLYGEVPRYLFEHPVFGQYMELDTRESDDCIECGEKDEDANADEFEAEADEKFFEPLTTKTTKDK